MCNSLFENQISDVSAFVSALATNVTLTKLKFAPIYVYALFSFARCFFFPSLYENPLNDAAMASLQRMIERNIVFGKRKLPLLLFQLSSRRRELHVAAELWDVLAMEFLLPLCMN